jgi:hypothetical protein
MPAAMTRTGKSTGLDHCLKVKQHRDRLLKQILVIDDFTFEIREEWQS